MGISERAWSASRIMRAVLVAVVLCALVVPATPAVAVYVPPSISGTVTDSVTSAAMANVGVELRQVDPVLGETFLDSTKTDASGTYSFGGVAPGSGYYLVFYTTGYAQAYASDLTYSGLLLDIDVTMDPLQPIVAGTVTDDVTTNPLEGVAVDAYCYLAAEGYYEWVGGGTTDSNGAYTVYNEYQYGAGSYQFLASRTAYQTGENYQDWNGSTLLNADFSLVPAIEIAEGYLKDAGTGSPIPDETIEASWWNQLDMWYEWTGSGCTDATGFYKVYDQNALGAGDYELKAWPSGYARALRYQTWDGATALRQDFLVSPPAVIATGTVTSQSSGAPISGISVDACHWDDVNQWYDWTGSAYSDTDGTYSVADECAFGSGTYSFDVYGSGWVSQSVTNVWDGSTVLQLDFALVEAPIIAEGVVTDAETGGPIAQAWVDAEWYNAVDDWWEWAGSTVTAPDGLYTLRDENGWGAGSYKFVSYAEGYNSVRIESVWDGSSVLPIDFELSNRALPVKVEGADRFATAVQASQLAFPDDGMCSTAVVASGRNFPDALGGSALAGALFGPVLLVEPTALPSIVADEIQRLGVANVIVVGGTSAVSAPVKTAIDALPGVSTERIAGANRYETAALVAERTVTELEAGPGFSGQVMVATGQNFPDALAGAPLAASSGTPILLVQRDVVPQDTIDALNQIGADGAIVLGGTSAVSAAVASDIAGRVGPSGIVRLDGADRYVTASKIAQYGVDNFGLSWDGVAFATGLNFPDALAGGAAQGLTGSVVLLTKSTTLEAAPKTKLEANAGQILQVRFFGGLKAISQAVRDAVVKAINDNKPL